MGTSWLEVTSDCILQGSHMPEQSLAYFLRQQNLTILFMGFVSGPPEKPKVPWHRGYTSEWSKYAMTKPPGKSVVWHAHNPPSATLM